MLLQEYHDIVYSVSCTTRDPRGDEEDGIDYHWLAECGISVPEGTPLEIDPAYAVDAAQLREWGICLGAD